MDGKNVTETTYADDTVALVESEEQLHPPIGKLSEESLKKRLEITTTKTKIMVFINGLLEQMALAIMLA